jgi:hypothetical protein
MPLTTECASDTNMLAYLGADGHGVFLGGGAVENQAAPVVACTRPPELNHGGAGVFDNNARAGYLRGWRIRKRSSSSERHEWTQ